MAKVKLFTHQSNEDHLGWDIDPDYLDRIVKELPLEYNYLSWEEVEAVLLAVEELGVK